MSIMSAFGGLLIDIFNNTEITIFHAPTNETLENMPAMYKTEFTDRNPVGEKMTYQNLPHFRLKDIPDNWTPLSLENCKITQQNGAEWKIITAEKMPSGITNLFVEQKKWADS